MAWLALLEFIEIVLCQNFEPVYIVHCSIGKAAISYIYRSGDKYPAKGMTMPEFRTRFDPAYGEAVELAPGIRRITVRNGGPYTFYGTNTYLLGNNDIAVIDPGPEDDSHLDTIMKTVGAATVSHIFVTHTHMDHSPLADRLARLTGASVLAQGPHKAARELHIGEENPLDASADKKFKPDIAIQHGQTIETGEWALEAVHTPGHAANHCAFALAGTNILFSGDHVMAWSTTIVAPPDGSMADYMNSLDMLIQRRENIYFPGHGGRLENGREFSRALKAHRRMRESAILSRIRAGDRTVREIVKFIYRDIDPKLRGAAGLSVLAHIEDLLMRGKITSDAPPSLEGIYWPA
jgi:glyoxylase-like metal-dependent hydrolase (beta-lactamase superfamily II)